MLVYLDWNVFNNIEQLETLKLDQQLIYSKLKLIIKSDAVHIPYSNAHLSDLLRGFRKNPNYIEGHLKIIKELTNDLCICQYWKKENVIWHYRSSSEFFNDLIEEKEYESQNFEDLLKGSDSKLRKQLFKTLAETKVPDNFKLLYKEDPIFNIIYPKTKIEMNNLALCNDLYAFSLLLNKDYSIYKALKKLIIKAQNKLRKNQKITKTLKAFSPDVPNYLDIESTFNNFNQAEKTYELLKVKTKTLTPEEFIKEIELK